MTARVETIAHQVAGHGAHQFVYGPDDNPIEQINTAGTADTPLRWGGQYQGTDTGLYYLRARYYDPTTAHFLTRDPLGALTQSIYDYSGENPLNLADPLGLWDWELTATHSVESVW